MGEDGGKKDGKSYVGVVVGSSLVGQLGHQTVRIYRMSYTGSSMSQTSWNVRLPRRCCRSKRESGSHSGADCIGRFIFPPVFCFYFNCIWFDLS